MKKDLLRKISLGFFLVLFSYLSLRHFFAGSKEAASVDALCPFGGFETLYALVATGSYVPRIMVSSLILAIAMIITIIVFRRGFCGWVCPFGAVQEFLGLIIKKKPKIPKKWDRGLRYLKYIVLIVIIVGTAITGTLVFRGYDPFMTFFHFGKGIVWDYDSVEFGDHIIAFIITIFVLMWSVMITRFWCRYLCPLGAISVILSKLSLGKMVKKKCTRCKSCDTVCPVDEKPSKGEFTSECIDCMRCEHECPEGSISFKIFGLKISRIVMLIGLVVIIFGLVLGAKTMSVWQSVPDFKSSDGPIHPDSITGWMTLQETADATKIHLPHFIQDLGLYGVDPDTPLREIRNRYPIDFHTEELREYVKNFEHAHNQEAESAESECPWGLKNDPVKRCGFYEDTDQNHICDLSE